MDLEPYLQIRTTPPGAEGKESMWLEVGMVDLATGKLGVADPRRFPADTVLVVLRPDRYEILAKVLHKEGQRPLTRLRVVRAGAAGSRGAAMGRVPVDGRVGFCDYDALGALTDTMDLAAQERVLEGLGGVAGSLSWSPEVAMVHVAVSVPNVVVHELVSGDRRVGAEILLG